MVVHLEEADEVGARYGEFRQSNGDIVCFNIFEDSEYKLRKARPPQRRAMVKVCKADIQCLLKDSPEAAGLDAVIARLKAVVK